MKSKILAVVLTAVATLALVACGTLNPVAHAQTTEQKAYALYGEFVVIEEQAAEVAKSSEVSASIKLSIAAFDAAAKEAADSLLDAAVLVKSVRDDLARGKTTEEKLLIATANLERWRGELEPKLLRLASAIKGARK